MVQDPKLIDPKQPRIPDEWRRHYLMRPLDKLPADVTVAFDRLWQVEREKDRLRADFDARLRLANIKIWVLGLIITGQGAVIGWLVKEFLDRFVTH